MRNSARVRCAPNPGYGATDYPFHRSAADIGTTFLGPVEPLEKYRISRPPKAYMPSTMAQIDTIFERAQGQEFDTRKPTDIQVALPSDNSNRHTNDNCLKILLAYAAAQVSATNEEIRARKTGISWRRLSPVPRISGRFSLPQLQEGWLWSEEISTHRLPRGCPQV
jgi:hypothetical protein